ncbi:MAG: hypothetical protein CML55_09215 [Rhodobacteraceae bacterium]|nr:hypothetical protein [Paracoccaceae bacterium]
MRAVFYSDLIAAARALGGSPPGDRLHLCHRMLREADWADRYARRLGKVHPRWGNGTLGAAAGQYPQARAAAVNEADHLACLLVILRALEAKSAASTCHARPTA